MINKFFVLLLLLFCCFLLRILTPGYSYSVCILPMQEFCYARLLNSFHIHPSCLALLANFYVALECMCTHAVCMHVHFKFGMLTVYPHSYTGIPNHDSVYNACTIKLRIGRTTESDIIMACIFLQK